MGRRKSGAQFMNLETAVGHGTTRKGTEESTNPGFTVRHFSGHVMQAYMPMFIRVIPYVAAAELPFY